LPRLSCNCFKAAKQLWATLCMPTTVDQLQIAAIHPGHLRLAPTALTQPVVQLLPWSHHPALRSMLHVFSQQTRFILSLCPACINELNIKVCKQLWLS
jgi:hypothetical protein